MNQINKIVPTEHYFLVNWIPHIRCNYDCMYCPDNRHNDYSPLSSFDTMCQTWKQVFEKTKHRNLLYSISLGGGEATINKDFIPFIQWLSANYGQNISKIGITSNGSASLKYYLKIFEHLTFLSFSTHSEYMKDDFLNKIKILNIYAKKNNKIATVNIMQEYWATEKIKEIINFCKTHDIPHAISKIIYNMPGSRDWPIFKIGNQTKDRQDLKLTQELLNHNNQEIEPLVSLNDKYYNIEITLDDKSTQSTSASSLRYLNLHHFKGWQCHAGLDRIFILPDSSVYSGECENDFMGKLNDNSFELFDRPHPCKRETCTGNAYDLQVTKYAV
jgi:MoaA/NifB/PqqE/SkfB family radical SAM enzyme